MKGSRKFHENYKHARERGVKRIAMVWEDIVWEAVQAIGKDDANAWHNGMQDILVDPFFESGTIPLASAVVCRMRNKNPKVLGHVFVSPHPEAWHYKKKIQNFW